MGVWIGGAWIGDFPESEKMFRGRNLQEEPSNPAERTIFDKFQAPDVENSEPKKIAIPYLQPFHTPTRLPPRQSVCD